MTAAECAIRLRGETLQLIRGADVSDDRWDSVVGLFRTLSVTSDDHVISVDAAHIGRLRARLTEWPAVALEWRWTPAADAVLERIDQQAQAIKEIVNTSRDDDGWPDWAPSPEALGVRRRLTDEQQRDAGWLLRLGNGGNFSVPGAGKTTTTLVVWAAMRAMGNTDALLVVAPTSAFEAWQTEPTEVFAAERRPTVVLRPTTPPQTGDIVVVNYERLEQGRHLGTYLEWVQTHRATVVFDESHRVKAGRRGARGKAARRLARVAVRRLILTGTPMPNAPEDLAAQMDLCWPGYGSRFVNGDLAPHLESFYVRTTKDELPLPPLEVTVEPVSLTREHRRAYEAVKDRARRSLHESRSRQMTSVLELVSAATDPRSVDPSGPIDGEPAKLVRAREIVRRNAAEGRKTLVWSSFVDHVRRFAELVVDLDPAVVVGEVPVEDMTADTDRVREVKRFRSDPSCKVLIATPHTLGEGISLHASCRDQVHIDRTFAAALYLQSLDRTHRLGMGTEEPARVVVLVAEDTIDERVDELLSAKIERMASVLNDRTLQVLSMAGIGRGDEAAAAEALRKEVQQGDITS